MKLYYINALPHLIKYCLARPLLYVNTKAHVQNMKIEYAKQGFMGLNIYTKKVKIQAWNIQDLSETINMLDPVEIHYRMGHFHETELNEIIFDLDTDESVGIETAFDYGKGLIDWIKTCRHDEINQVRMLYSGNRGFHIRVQLKHRYRKELLKTKMDEWVLTYKRPFVGEVDTNMCNPLHFIRCPLSWNKKGQKFSYFVDNLSDFNEIIAQENSDRVKNKFGG